MLHEHSLAADAGRASRPPSCGWLAGFFALQLSAAILRNASEGRMQARAGRHIARTWKRRGTFVRSETASRDSCSRRVRSAAAYVIEPGARRPPHIDRSRSSPPTGSRTSWPAVPQESSLKAEVTEMAFLEIATERARRDHRRTGRDPDGNRWSDLANRSSSIRAGARGSAAHPRVVRGRAHRTH
jgi:hypothetical protein